MKVPGAGPYLAAGGVGSVMIGLLAIVQVPFLVSLCVLLISAGVAFLVKWMLDQRPACGHRYWSTACLHQEHGQCRLTCKFCHQLCGCGCHWRATM